jgi:uncharacterized protein YjdB
MFDRSCVGALLLGGLALSIAGCGSSTDIDTIQVSPVTQNLAAGTTAQFTATAIIHHGQHPSTSENVTGTATWTSSSTSVATVDAAGVATAVSAGIATITASVPGFGGTVSGSATLTVTGSTGGGTGQVEVVSLAIIPGTQSVASPKQTSQFLAIGTTNTGETVDLTTHVAWYSSSIQIATIDSFTGMATAVGQGTATITALYTNSGTLDVVSGSATFTVVGGTAEPISALTISPATQSLSATGQTGQFFALGTTGSSGLQQDVTNSSQIKWISSIPTVATVTSGLPTGNGLAKGVSAGNTNVTAEWTNPDGSSVTASAVVTVTDSAAPEPLLSLTIVPNDITVGNLQDTGNFLAIGTFSTPPNVRDLTNSVTWLSSSPNAFPVSTNSSPPNSGAPGGVVTAYGTGTAVIIAEATDPTTGSIQTATATFNCPLILPTPTNPGSCYPGSQAPGLLVTMTVYNEGLNATNWLVTAPSATNTPDVIHCGPGWAADKKTGGSVCTATYPLGTTVVLTAPTQKGVAFGGWSYNCTPSDKFGNPLSGPVFWTANGPNYCAITLGSSESSNVTVGAIFN